MSEKTPLPQLADYEAIEAAVMETARGRWFLAEHARRVRAMETGLVLSAIARLESGIAVGSRPERDTVDLQVSLAEMAGQFTRMAAELTAVIMEARIEARGSSEVESTPEPVLPIAAEPRSLSPAPVASPERAPRAAFRDAPPVSLDIAPPVALDPAPAVETAPSPGRRSVTERMSALTDLDLLDTREKLRRFT